MTTPARSPLKTTGRCTAPDASQPRILIIYTGGTIGMIENAETRALEPFNFDHLIENVPKIKLLDIEIESVEFSNPIDSSSMNPLHWQSIAKVIEDNYTKFDGFVVLHGTDTMAYTASALSFMLENLDKPVIITGSQLPIGDVRTDGEENLITALQVASARDTDGSAMVREVAILLRIFCGEATVRPSIPPTTSVPSPPIIFRHLQVSASGYTSIAMSCDGTSPRAN